MARDRRLPAISAIPEAERFVECWSDRSPVNLMISSRRRPIWATSRLVVYGSILEVGQAQLALNDEEAVELLEEQPPPDAARLTRLANGWPAVIGLAGIATTDFFPDGSAPEELYDFFAEEVYRVLDEDIQVDLGVLVIPAALDRELAVALLGAERAERSLREALAIGVLDERGDRLEFQPLARSFIENRTHREALASRSKAVDFASRCIAREATGIAPLISLWV